MAEIVETPEVLGGKPRTEGRRISVLHVVDQIQGGRTPEEVTTQFDLTLGEVHTALAYYYEHPEEMHELREEVAERVREHREEAITGPEDLPDDLRSDEEPSQRP
ncbi:MAG: DUF433 domain-containing protein [Halobacteriales archaeon SW_9_67_24]|jgi:uncharacterized protein (DUF433 family)|nr:MAG: DUF433 domain-containing protein [Halobacteriales archaeon SW_9_67_24]